MGLLKPTASPASVASKATPDLVWILTTYYPHRVGFMRAGEVSDLSRELSNLFGIHVTERQITIAMAQAMSLKEVE